MNPAAAEFHGAVTAEAAGTLTFATCLAVADRSESKAYLSTKQRGTLSLKQKWEQKTRRFSLLNSVWLSDRHS